ncbi:hypothetical protein [Carboxylicivirga sp. N1Y90]|uniref:hypothetical protein n=1 Tax=Carboxylicivirga fragile TaxID=3417571 RepID=UPI003D355952|nr:DUF4270 family protein [Marinilabiliaceae bacterium N1Y90]
MNIELYKYSVFGFRFKLMLLLSLVYTSCTKGSLNPGKVFVSSSTYTTLIDSVTVQFSTIKLDSFVTSSASSALIGHHEHALLGSQEVKSYFPLVAPSSFDWDDEEVLDSIVLRLVPNGYYLGDTTELFDLEVYPLFEEIETSDDGYLYNLHSFQYDESNSLGKKQFRPKPGKGSAIEVRLKDEFAREIVDFMQAYENHVDKITLFKERFNGVVLNCDRNTTNSVLGITLADSVPHVRLYSHKVSLEKETIIRDLNLEVSSRNFNQFINHDSDNDYSTIASGQDKLVETASNGLLALQAGSGYEIRVDFPYLNNLLEIKQLGHEVKAELHIRPNSKLSPWSELPDLVYISELDRINANRNPLLTSEETALSGTLYLDKVYNEETFYVFDVSDYLNYRLTESIVDTEKGLVFSLPSDDLVNSFASLIVNGSSFSNNASQLYIYYYYYDNQ